MYTKYTDDNDECFISANSAPFRRFRSRGKKIIIKERFIY